MADKIRFDVQTIDVMVRCNGSTGFEHDVTNPPEGVELPIKVTQTTTNYCTHTKGSTRQEMRVECVYLKADPSDVHRPYTCTMGSMPGRCRYCHDLPCEPSND